jgi:repressor LexA
MNSTEKKDQKGYAYIRNQVVHTGVTPSLRDIADAVGYSSRHSAEKMLSRLEERNFIKWEKGVIRLCHRTPNMSERTVDVPLVGSVACGAPTLAEQDYEALIPVSTRMAKPGNTYFLLRARGTSMNKTGIDDGDLLLVRQQPTADNGDKVVALINDDATVKRFYLDHENGVVILKPDSTDKRHQPIILSDDFMIQGVVVATLPKNIY